MSAMLLGLAWKARLDTNRKIVLMRLVDAAEDDGTRIFPSKQRIARDTGLGVRTVQRILRGFEGEGLLRIVAGEKGGWRRTTEYRLSLQKLAAMVAAFEEAEPDEDPEDDAEQGDDRPAEGSERGATVTPLAERGATGDATGVSPATERGATAWHTTPPYPSIDPSGEREARARAIGIALRGVAEDDDDPEPVRQDDGKASDGRTLDDFRTVWPHIAQDDQDLLTRKWLELSPEERAEAIDGVERFLADRKAAGGKGGIYGWKYLADKRWRFVASAPAKGGPENGAACGPKIDLPPWSRAFWLVLCRRTASGDRRRAHLLLQMAKSKLPARADAAEAPDEDLAGCVAVRADAPEFGEWRDWLSARGVPVPILEDEMWCHMPARRPDEWRG